MEPYIRGKRNMIHIIDVRETMKGLLRAKKMLQNLVSQGKDVLSPLGQRRPGFVVGKLPDHETLSVNPLSDALADNTVTPVDEQVAFRMDFPQWLSTYSDRDRRLALDMLAGERTLDVSDKFGLSPGRISRMRMQFHDSWQRFQDGPPDADA